MPARSAIRLAPLIYTLDTSLSVIAREYERAPELLARTARGIIGPGLHDVDDDPAGVDFRGAYP